MPENANVSGGLGGSLGSIANELTARAIREEWPIGDEGRRRTTELMLAVVDDPESSCRARAIATRNLIAMNAQNLLTRGVAQKLEVTGKDGGPVETANVSIIERINRRADFLATLEASEMVASTPGRNGHSESLDHPRANGQTG